MTEVNGRELPTLDTFPGLLLALTALSGEMPNAQVSRLPAADTYKEYAVKQLKRDNLLRTFYRNGVRGLRLTAAAKDLLMASWPDQFSLYLSGSVETNQLKSEVSRRLRLHRMAEVLVTMYNADISVLPWEKPALFGPVPPDEIPVLEQAAYYSSRELKELGKEAVKIRGSRSTGILLTDGDIFVIYNTGPGQMKKWKYSSEVRLRVMLMMELEKTRVPARSRRTAPSAVIFAADMSQMFPLMGDGKNDEGGKRGRKRKNGKDSEDGRHNYFVLDGTFEHFYYLTHDHRGEVILQLLCYPGEKAILDSRLSGDLDPPRPNWMVANDAMDGDEPVLFAYTCDMPRIRRFDSALAVNGRKGSLYCFDFQEDAIRQVCSSRVRIKTIDFDEYERSVFLSPENS